MFLVKFFYFIIKNCLICNEILVGLPSPNGWQSDNVNKTGILVLKRENIRGAINQFKLNDKILEQNLENGHFTIFNNIEHNTTPITPIDNNREAFRDVIILNALSYQ